MVQKDLSIVIMSLFDKSNESLRYAEYKQCHCSRLLKVKSVAQKHCRINHPIILWPTFKAPINYVNDAFSITFNFKFYCNYLSNLFNQIQLLGWLSYCDWNNFENLKTIFFRLKLFFCKKKELRPSKNFLLPEEYDEYVLPRLN